MILKGVVKSGKQEASFFVLSRRYQKFFRELLSAPPYPGTLNLLLYKEIELRNLYEPPSARPIRRARLSRIASKRIKGIVLIPGRKRSREVEIVSTVKLRNLLDLEDGKEVMFSVEE